MTDKPRLLGINQATSILFRSVMDAFGAEGVDCVLVAGDLETSDGYKPKFRYISAKQLEKAPAWRRIWSWGRFTFQSLCRIWQHRDHFALLVSNPPLVPWLGPFVKRWFGTPYALLIYDIYPNAMVQMGMIRPGGMVDRILGRFAANSYRHAECVITLGERMKQVILDQLPPESKVDVKVIPNWADIDFIRPVARENNPFIQEHGLLEKQVVMYSGAFGATHDIKSIIDAAEILQDLPDISFVLIGGGTQEKEVRRYVENKQLPNLLMLPWQPLERIQFSLTAADFHIISLDAAFEGISVPSKTYTALAAQAAIICIGGRQNEVADLIKTHNCGRQVNPRDPQALAQAIRDLVQNRPLLERMQQNAREAAEKYYSSAVCLKEYRRVLMPLMQSFTTG